MLTYAFNPTPAQLRTGRIDTAVRELQGLYVAWTKTWEGPGRPDYPAAAADLRERLGGARLRRMDASELPDPTPAQRLGSRLDAMARQPRKAP